MGCCVKPPRVDNEMDIDEMDMTTDSEIKAEQEGSAGNDVVVGQADPLSSQHGRTEHTDANRQTENAYQHGSYANMQTDDTAYQHGSYANMQTDDTAYQHGSYANMQTDDTNQHQHGNDLTIPSSRDQKEQPLPVSTNDQTMIAQVGVEDTAREPTRNEVNVVNQTDGHGHEVVNQVTEEEFMRNQMNVENQTEFMRNPVTVEDQTDGYVHEVTNQPAGSSDVGIVFEGRTYRKRVFDELLNAYVYVADEQETQAKIGM